ncbi:CobW family GTP-binding protein [Colwellia echini]|uniref:GTP-binding protein n=1 Tax=Colwellia echini TaxID=1982103 RepID=A0ABY3MT43_9GAMM|nr:GTP-binding protein [Colwellia echini]TYK64353.1 GTP-binding protein [Colwellia echini]
MTKSSLSNKILSVPTHIITGFLGAGKTSTILTLLANKPANERWAVLVNEFGEIGVDGSLLAGQFGEEQGVFISEVPGGCMCCAAGVPMQIALNKLLKHAKPDRLLIEPTGLGHPKEVLQALSAPHYQQVLSLQKTLTLVDARLLADTRYTSHDIFNQQIAIADIIVGSKADLYQESDKTRLVEYIKIHGKNKALTNTPSNVQVVFAHKGELLLGQQEKAFSNTEFDNLAPAPLADKTVTLSLLSLLNKSQPTPAVKPFAKSIFTLASITPEAINIKGSEQQSINHDNDFSTIGWRFDATTVFNYEQLLTVLNSIDVERLKAVFYTNRGIFGYNIARDDVNENDAKEMLTEVSLTNAIDSRIELIIRKLDDTAQKKTADDIKIKLMRCMLAT